MGEAFLVAFLQVLVDKLAHREVFKYFGLIKGVDQKMKKWRETLSAIGAVLNEAEERQLTTDSEPLNLWLEDLRDLAYNVEEVWDKYATKKLKHEIEMQGHHASARSKVRKLIPNGVFNIKMNSEIQKITDRLQEISQRRQQLGLNNVPGTTFTKSRQNIPSSRHPDGPVIGRVEDKKLILELLSKQERLNVNFDVVSIVGMAGVGKTTLAGEVFNDVDAALQFKPKVWVCVSDDFNLEKVTKQILESITSQQYPTGDFNKIQDLLHKKLAGKKFLIVLDDVWDTCSYGQWMKLQSPFRDGALGSKILVTTRDGEISKMVGAGSLVHYLKPMENHDCLEVFEQHAFLNANRPPKFELLKDKIAKRCRGLPLAARTLGGLLLRKEIDKWEEILDNNLWSLSNERDILPVLRLSYHYLPSKLKRCFAYCSILPNDYEFEEKQLILLWMAEGLIQPRPEENKQMEDLGTDYFQELLSRSLFQKSNKSNSKYVMHDLVGDLARWTAGKICFRLEDKLDGNMQFKGSPEARHASYICGRYDGVKKFEAFREVKRLRTFLPLSNFRGHYLDHKVTFDLLPQLHYLRVLSLKGYTITQLPNSIGDLRYLRYLDLSYTQITCLPESTSTLYNLQTLILEGCYKLKALPTDMSNLIHLRHLDYSYVYSWEGMPPQLSRLTNLQSLPNFVVGKGSDQSGIGEIGPLSQLRGTLCLSQLENVINVDDARRANLISKERLDALCLEWSTSEETRELETDVLEMLRPHGKLKELTIKGYAGKKFSTWIEVPILFCNMVIVRLERCNNCVLLPPLGQLPSLKELHIDGMHAVESVGPEFYGEVKLPFPLLETLKFEDMQNWEKWLPYEQDLGSGVFPCLKMLSVRKCSKLEGKLPENLDSLEKLEIFKCEELVVSIASYKQVSELSIEDCKGVVHTTEVDFELLEKLSLSNISELMFQTGQLTKGLGKVKDLKIRGCKALTSSLKNEDRLLQHLISLDRLVIGGNSALVEELGKEAEELVQLSILDCKLEYLTFENCDGVSKVPKGLHHLSSLGRLEIYGCPSLVFFSDVAVSPSLKVVRIEKCDSLMYFAKYQIPPNLRRIMIWECKSLKSLVEEEANEDALGSSSSSFYSLDDLEILNCESLTSLSFRGQYFPRALKNLEIFNCQQLELIASDGFFFDDHTNYCLEYIHISGCPNIKCLPEGLCHLTNLQTLYIEQCGSLVSIPRLSGGLRWIWITSCGRSKELPEDMHNLNSLEELTIDYPEGFTSFPPNLISLDIRGVKSCKRLWELELGSQRLTSLRKLWIAGDDPDVVSFPPESDDMVQKQMETLLPKSLTHLTIGGFPNLKKLSSKGFQFLTSLEYLGLEDCPKLASIPLPEEGLPLSLTELSISSCPVLKERCQPRSKGRFSYWPKLSHIPCIMIDGEWI